MRWGTRQPLPLPIAFVSFVAVLAVLLAAVFALPAAAHADEPAEGDNAVNTQQLPDSSFIYDTSIVDLSGADAYYDNQTVQVTGEVIGDSIRAGVSGRHRWITLSSQGDDLGVYEQRIGIEDRHVRRVWYYGHHLASAWHVPSRVRRS